MPRDEDTVTPRVTGVRPPAPLQTGAHARADWTRWKEDWDDYAIVQDVTNKPDNMQCSLFRIALGADGKKLLRNQPVPTTPDGARMDPEKLDTLILMVKTAVLGEVNDTYERYVFRTRTQQKGETFDEFLLALREMQKTCDVCEHMADKFLKDQIIFGVRDDSVREKLLQERQLTLPKTIDMCRAAESASVQAKDMATASPTEVNRVTGKKHSHRKWKGGRNAPHHEKKECRFCGKWHAMTAGVCPALGKTCGKCGDKNHFAKKCPRKVHQLSAEDPEEELFSDTADIGAVTHQVCVLSTGPRAKLRVQGKTKAFLLDTGASANLISSHDVDTRKLRLTTPGRKFTMWNGTTQQAMGRTSIQVYNPVTKLTYDVNFDVVSDKLTPILGCRTIQEMGLIQLNTGTYDSVSSVQPQFKSHYYKEFPEVFNKDVGTLEGRVSLQMNKDVTPTALPARQIPIALRQPVKEELRRLQALDVITPVTSPAENTAHSNKTKRQAVIKKHHDKTAAPLPPLSRGSCVWYARWNGDRENWARGKIIDTNGRSYIITAENGATYRRNRVQIRPDLTNRNQADDTDDDDDDEATTRSRPQHKQPNTARCNQGHGFVPLVRSRSGRIIKSVVR